MVAYSKAKNRCGCLTSDDKSQGNLFLGHPFFEIERVAWEFGKNPSNLRVDIDQTSDVYAS
jgi:hypothetical protein